MTIEVSKMDAEPLIHVLKQMTAYGREMKPDEAAPDKARIVELAMKAHAAMMWLAKDGEGDLDAAARWLQLVWA